jgi:hypothetical protein
MSRIESIGLGSSSVDYDAVGAKAFNTAISHYMALNANVPTVAHTYNPPTASLMPMVFKAYCIFSMCYGLGTENETGTKDTGFDGYRFNYRTAVSGIYGLCAIYYGFTQFSSAPLLFTGGAWHTLHQQRQTCVSFLFTTGPTKQSQWSTILPYSTWRMGFGGQSQNGITADNRRTISP